MADSTEQFPITNKQTAIDLDGVHTEILLTGFADKIFVIETTLDIAPQMAPNPSAIPTTSQVLMGESVGEQCDLYMLYSTSIIQAIAAMNPNEKRPLLLGIALKPVEGLGKRKEIFNTIIDQVFANPVW